MAVPGQFIVDKLLSLLAADTASLAAVAVMKVNLIKAAFTPGPALTVAGLTKADFGGYALKSPTSGTQQTFNDAPSGGRLVQLLEPAGGWHWQPTSTLNLPQTIYGYYVSDNADATVYFSALFQTPVVLTAVNDGVDIPFIRMLLPPGVLS